MRRTSRKFEEKENNFWEKEREANNVRKKSLDSLEYVHIPYDLLPFGTAEENPTLAAAEDELMALKDEKIVNFTGITNTDLKLEYGTANITALTQFDQNYTALVVSLQKWGDALYNAGRFEDACQVLEFAVKTRTDISATYRLLIDMYKTKLGFNEATIKSKLEGLLPIAKNLNALSRNQILNMLAAEGIESEDDIGA
jgi:predicted nucleotidyltransferase